MTVALAFQAAGAFVSNAQGLQECTMNLGFSSGFQYRGIAQP